MCLRMRCAWNCYAEPVAGGPPAIESMTAEKAEAAAGVLLYAAEVPATRPPATTRRARFPVVRLRFCRWNRRRSSGGADPSQSVSRAHLLHASILSPPLLLAATMLDARSRLLF